MQTFILGGTGSIGSAIVPCLVARGHSVHALARSGAAEASLAAFGAVPVRGTLENPSEWIGALEDADALIHVADTFGDDMPGLDALLLESIHAQWSGRTDLPALLYTGGCWLFGDTSGPAIDETAPFNCSPQFQWAADHIGLLSKWNNVRSVIIHPGMVYDGCGGVFRHFTDAARAGGPVKVAGSAEVVWPLVHREDLAELYVLALEKARAGSVYHGVVQDGVKALDIACAVARRYGVPEAPQIISEDVFAAELGEWACGYAISQRISGAKAQRELGWSPSRNDVYQEIAGADDTDE